MGVWEYFEFKIKNWYVVVEEFVSDFREKIEIYKWVESESKWMEYYY